MKEKANSSEELLEREGVVALLETAKEKLKGAAQAGLVTGSAAAAVRAAVMRLAAALHEADKRHRDTNETQRKKVLKYFVNLFCLQNLSFFPNIFVFLKIVDIRF